jgi:hypothetical protein
LLLPIGRSFHYRKATFNLPEYELKVSNEDRANAFMLKWLTKRVRRNLAFTLGALYVVCSIAPAMALATGDVSVGVHCLTDDHHAGHVHGVAAKPHAHADGTFHRHSADNANTNHDDGKTAADSGSCCGLFCLSALPADAAFALSQPVYPQSTALVLEHRLVGNNPDRIDRPPRA